MRKKIKKGDEVFIVMLLENFPHPNRHFNVNNYIIVKSKVIEKGRNKIIVQLVNEKEVVIKRNACFFSQSEADQFRYHIVYDHLKNKSIERITNDIAELLLPNFEPKFTGNVLRFGERNMIWNLPNWDDEITEGKIIQLIATTKEDVDILINILEIIVFANDYAKKLIGKYIIIELNNLYLLLHGGVDSKGLKDLNEKYGKSEFQSLKRSIQSLEEKYQFRLVRDKIAAHKDSNILFSEYQLIWSKINIEFLEEYWEMLCIHLEEILSKYYPNEKLYYFLLPEETIPKTSELIRMAMPETVFPFDDSYEIQS